MRIRRPKRHNLRAVLGSVVILLGCLVAISAKAELALLTNGDFLKVDAYQLVENEKLRLDLDGGGTLFLPVDSVERIVDDEIEPATESVPLPRTAAPTSKTGVNLRWHAGAKQPEGPYGSLFFQAGKRYQLNPTLLAAMARAESAYDPSALSHKGARGILQLMPATAERFGVRKADLYNPERNIEAASKYLNFLIKEFDGELKLVLAAYNAGEGNVRKHGGVPPFRETRDYIRRIYRFLGVES